MLLFLRRSVIAALFLCLPLTVRAEDSKPPNSALAAADQLMQSGKFAEAEADYRALIEIDATLVPAQLGLVRSLLRQQKVDDAWETVNAASTALSYSAALLAAKGDVQFRLAQMSEAETSYLDAKQLDPKEIHAYLGLTRLYRCQSMYRQAYDELQRVHDIAPNNPEVQKAWLSMLPRRERLAALQAYIAAQHPEDEDESTGLADALAFLKETADKPAHACKLVNKVEHTEVRLDILRDISAGGHAVSLSAKINDLSVSFTLDTGAGGILLTRKMAEKAGVTRIADVHYLGTGDKGVQSGYAAVADHIHIGDLEFQDCVISVSDKLIDSSQDGLIGADVFAHFLVDIDLPGSRLVLSLLPKRPSDTITPPALNSEVNELANTEQKESPDTAQTATEKVSSSHRLPQDRYIAPEMAKWTRVFRINHYLLVPTNVNDAPPALFILDTGAFDNVLAVRAGRQVTKVKSRLGNGVRGLSGNVKKVYSAKVTLGFGHLQQSNVDTVAVDLSNLSGHAGTEVSGLLGFAMLQMLDLKIDYRDGLVNMEFDPKRVQHLLKK